MKTAKTTIMFATVAALGACVTPQGGDTSAYPDLQADNDDPNGVDDTSDSKDDGLNDSKVDDDDGQKPTGAIDDAELDGLLDQLREFQIIEVGQLVRDYPEGALNCYGPCPEFVDEINAIDQVQLERLRGLVDLTAELSDIEADPQACNVYSIATNLGALDGLRIVEVQELVEEVPSPSAYCYNLPCPDELERAEQVTCQRATVLRDVAYDAVDSL